MAWLRSSAAPTRVRALAKAAMIAAGFHFVSLSTPAVAWAQSAGSPQPVPYGTPSVPYGQAATPPAAAHAAAGGDVIYLKNGGLLRGTIIDAIPNSQARIQLATGEIATVPWQEINRIEQAAGKPASPAPAAATPKPAGATSKVWVHIDGGSDDVRLQQDQSGDDDWITVCSAPCDKELPTAFYYRIVGDGIKASGEFTLHAQPGEHETVEAHGASKTWFIIGIIAIPVGLIAAYVGFAVGIVGTLLSTANNISGTSSTNSDAAAGLGWTILALGLGAAVGGLVLVIVNAKTGTTQHLGTASATTGLLLGDAWKRVPTWREPSAEQRALPPILGIPLVAGTF
ncbi:MAG TPA: hypothetical protein VKU41_33265 [Polyangiaceae bacterium]|nr:hypothetical protein [Polyangiaceae bacterium]